MSDDRHTPPQGEHHHDHHAPEHHPPAPEPRQEQPECPVLAMSGGGCVGAADAATLGLSLPHTRTAADAYPPAAGVHDRLLAEALFHPPRA